MFFVFLFTELSFQLFFLVPLILSNTPLFVNQKRNLPVHINDIMLTNAEVFCVHLLKHMCLLD